MYSSVSVSYVLKYPIHLNNKKLHCGTCLRYEVYEEPNQMTMKQTMRSQTKACITNSRGLRSSEILGSTEW